MEPRVRLMLLASLASVGTACGAGGSSGTPGDPGAGTAIGGGTGSGGSGNLPGAPMLGGVGGSALNGPRPAPGADLPSVSAYAAPLDGLTTGPGFGDDPNFSGHPACAADCQDFQQGTRVEFSFTGDEATFAQTPTGPAPCILEPQNETLFPANWTRPRIRFSGGGNQHQIRLHAQREANDLVVYTGSNPWIMPREVWDGLRKNVYEEPISITVRSSTDGGPVGEATASFQIAPVQAGGSIVFWASRSQAPGGNTTQLLGFSPGDEAVISTLVPNQVDGTILDDSPTLKRAITAQPAQNNQPAIEAVAVGRVRCVGCHTSTPDGDAVQFTDHWPWNSKVARITGDIGGRPAYVTDLGDLLLQMPWQGTSTFSRDDWIVGGRRRVITSYEGRPITRANFVPDANNPQGAIYPHEDSDPDQLAWIDLAAAPLDPDPLTQLDQNGQRCATTPCPNPLQRDRALSLSMLNSKGTAWNVLARSGDALSAVTPDWSHDGLSVAYTSTNDAADGHLDNATQADIYTVPFTNGAGGQARAVPGASQANAFEYYPDFSADDQYLAFNRMPAQGVSGQIYYRPESEIYVVPRDGAAAPTRLRANDPPACSGESSPGVYNSWPKWSPLVRSSPPDEPYSGRTYYFFTFASARSYPGSFSVGGGQNGAGARQSSQLYMGAMVVTRSGAIESFPALYLWNQSFLTENGEDVAPLSMSNLTPAWDDFAVPPIVVVIQ